MEYPGVMILGTSARADHSSDTSQMVHVEVALIDKTHQGEPTSAHPSAYQIHELPLNQAKMSNSKQVADHITEDAFVMMGKVEKVDKEKRQLILSNGTIVCYKHLIVAAGSRHTYIGHDNVNEFRTGIQALAEAIRLRQTVTDVPAPKTGNPSRRSSRFEKQPKFPAKAARVVQKDYEELERVLKGKLAAKESSEPGVAVGSQMPKVFCEVQPASMV